MMPVAIRWKRRCKSSRGTRRPEETTAEKRLTTAEYAHIKRLSDYTTLGRIIPVTTRATLRLGKLLPSVRRGATETARLSSEGI
jgi:hypothetical protein